MPTNIVAPNIIVLEYCVWAYIYHMQYLRAGHEAAVVSH